MSGSDSGFPFSPDQVFHPSAGRGSNLCSFVNARLGLRARLELKTCSFKQVHLTPSPTLRFCLCAVVDMFPPQFLISRSILKLLYISFSVLHTWPQSVEILPVCTVMQDHSLSDTSYITLSLFQFLPVWPFPFVVPQSLSVSL